MSRPRARVLDSFNAVTTMVALLAAASPYATRGKDQREATANSASSSDAPTIIIGFLGGIVKRDDPIRSEVKLAKDLRDAHYSGVQVETFENRHRKEAYKTILRILDTDHDGSLSDAEKRSARIILYGHSLGGSAAVHLARDLQKKSIPVLLTVQVDSVARIGEHYQVIPPNVVRAANFYQPNGVIHGRAEIRAEDPSKTQILGNFRFDYKDHPVDCREYPWYERAFAKTHTEIGCDPNVWTHVEVLIRSQLLPPGTV